MTLASTPSDARAVAGDPAAPSTVPPVSTVGRIRGTRSALGFSTAAALPASSAVAAKARATVAHPSMLASWIPLYATLVWTVGWPDASSRFAFVPLLVGIVALGLPHGALDPWVPARVGFAWGRRWRPVTVYMVGYVAAVVLYLAVWRVAPVVAFVGFLVATIVHWGHGDVRYLEEFHGRRSIGRVGLAIGTVLRGSLPIVVPVLAHPHEAESLLRHAASALGSAGVEASLTTSAVRIALGSFLAVATAAYAALLPRVWTTRRGGWIDAAEVVGLVLFFTVVPAYLAVGTYFMGWHALRHLARLLPLRHEDARDLARGNVARPGLRLARDLLPMTVLACALLVGLYLWAHARISTVEGFVALYLVWISALTKPHALVVAAMDVAPGRTA